MFEIYEKLGEGGYGAVYRARHKETGFTLAIKMIDLADEAEKIMHEIDILKKCRNFNIVSYYGSVVNANKLWILMDYCSLGSIADVLAECNPLNEEQIAHICGEVLKGLAYLHASKIIHRDVKAANILLTNQAHVKIVDFGISAQIDKSEKMNEPVGSPFWMAPEVIMETEHTYKCDIWSLGITVLEMAEGAPPHSSIHPFRALFLIPKKPPPTFSNPSKWSSDAIDFVNQCLQKQPHERPSAVELLVKKSQGPEVLRSTIITYLKAKKEKQMKLKREIAKLGRRPDGASSPTSSPSSPRVPHSPTPDESLRKPSRDLIPSVPLSPKAHHPAPSSSPKGEGGPPLSPKVTSHYSRPSSTPPLSPRMSREQAYDTANGYDHDGSEAGSPSNYQTMFVMGSLNTGDMPIHVKSLDAEETELKRQSVLQSNEQFDNLRQMIIDTKVEICRVREEVSCQNAVLKGELHGILMKWVIWLLANENSEGEYYVNGFDF